MIKCKAEDKIEEIKALYQQGMGNRRVSKLLSIPRSSLKYLCDKYGIGKQELVKKYLNMTQEQREVFVGVLLGDGSISKRFVFNIGHSDKQREYFNHKISLFPQFQFKIYENRRLDKRTGNEYTTLQAHSLVFEELKTYRNLFYKEEKKIISEDILLDFTSRSLAYLFMDDGTGTKYSTSIALCNFDDDSISTFRIFLMQKWKLETTVSKQKVLRIRQKNISIFHDLIRPYIVESMSYKIGSR